MNAFAVEDSGGNERMMINGAWVDLARTKIEYFEKG